MGNGEFILSARERYASIIIEDCSMEFKFNFPDPNDAQQSTVNNVNECCEIKNVFDRSCETFYISPKYDKELFEELDSSVCHIDLGEYTIKYMSPYVLLDSLKSKEEITCLTASELEKSDLLPGLYEGGLKIWECSFDLASYICKHNCIKPCYTVLELGCGAGIPGLLAYLAGAKVTFQDFNAEVLRLVTVNNVMLNTSKIDRENISQKCKFLSGDWRAIQNHFFGSGKKEDLYDIILTSETIYEKQSHHKLLNLMKSALKVNGRIYLAAKAYYFGVGGNLHDFERLVKEDGVFSSSEVHFVTEGVERRILQMEFKTNDSLV